MGRDRRFKVRTAEVTASVDDDGEVVVIDLSSGIYYSLEQSGGLVWVMLELGHGTAAIADELAQRFSIERDRAAGDVDRLIEQLLKAGIVEEADSDLPVPAEIDLPATTAGYAPPVLEKYADMSDLLAMDPPMPGITNRPWRSSSGNAPDGG